MNICIIPVTIIHRLTDFSDFLYLSTCWFTLKYFCQRVNLSNKPMDPTCSQLQMFPFNFRRMYMCSS